MHQAIWAALDEKWDATQPELDALGWMLSVTLEQAKAVAVVLPSTAQASTPSPSDAPPLPELLESLATARLRFQEAATDPTVASPLIWASMAAWTAGSASVLKQPDPSLGTVRELVDPAPGSPSQTAEAAVSAAFETYYGLQVIAGTPELPPKKRRTLASLATKWREWGESLASLAGLGAMLPEPYYQTDRPESAEAAVDAVGQLLAGLMPHIGRAIFFAEPELLPVLTAGLITAAEQAPQWGAKADRWPGLP